MKEKPSQEKSLAKSRAPLGNDGKTEKYFTQCNIEREEDYEVQLTHFYIWN